MLGPFDACSLAATAHMFSGGATGNGTAFCGAPSVTY